MKIIAYDARNRWYEIIEGPISGTSDPDWIFIDRFPQAMAAIYEVDGERRETQIDLSQGMFDLEH